MTLFTQQGVTLFEVLLVLVIATSLIMLGFQTYNEIHAEEQIQQVRQNVDRLFQGARNYYLANCRANRSYATGAVITAATGQLDPTVNPPASPIKKINIVTDLVTPGYLPQWPPAYTPIFMTGNYAVQFNLYNNAVTYPANVKNVNFCVRVAAPPSYACVPVPTRLTNNVYLWTIQVAVQVRNATQAQYYRSRLNANCLSRLVAGVVTPCSQVVAAPANDYLVFERLPSLALSTSNTSPLWASAPNLGSFTKQYTNDGDYSVSNNDATYNNSTGYENDLCGG